MTNPLPFGPATIEIGEGADALKLDGVNYFQVDGGEFNAEPILSSRTMAIHHMINVFLVMKAH
jgi:hypothetical protein